MSFFKHSLDEKFLQTPLPLVNRIKKMIFGPARPPLLVRIVYYLSSLIAFVFLIWHSLGFFAVFLRSVVFEKKKIAVDEILAKNAKAFGYSLYQLVWSLQIHHFVSVVIWFNILLFLIVFWRGKIVFQYLIFFALICYLIQGTYFFGQRFLFQELTHFDWILLAALVISILVSIFSHYLQKDKSQI